MKRCFFLLIICVLSLVGLQAQTISQKLQSAYKLFEDDSQLRHAVSSLYVINAKTGEVVFDKNSQTGLAPASTQKIITAATAFELLGKDYRYKTDFGLYPKKSDAGLALYIKPSGDPTFGSWRWENHTKKKIIDRLIDSVKRAGFKSPVNGFIIPLKGWDYEEIPDGWIWQDIANYYGAGAGAVIWGENQFDVILKSGSKIGDPVEIVNTIPKKLAGYELSSQVTSAAKGSGDNSYIYFSTTGEIGLIRGTIPVNEGHFTISGALPSGFMEFTQVLEDSLKVSFEGDGTHYYSEFNKADYKPAKFFYTEYSPTLDSIIYWFLQKSINLYGEALVKTFSFEKKGVGSTDTGVAIIKDFWKAKGLDPEELNMYDGSGLSPLNRVTTHAQVEVLKYAKKQSWFPYYFAAFPQYNNMKMKSGTISDVKGFCGYQASGDGNEYIFSFLVNNYSGSSALLIQKMYKVLDQLK